MNRILNKAFLGLNLALILFAYSTKAQNPVSFSVNVKPAKVRAGEKLTAQISASIDGGWHIYSLAQGAGGPVPTRITIADGAIKAAGSPRGSAPKREMDANFGIVTETHSGAVSFSVPLVVDVSAQPGPQTVSINVRYQACNDKLCLPPKTAKLSGAVEILAGAATAIASLSPTPTPTPSANTKANIATNSNQSLLANTGGLANSNTNIDPGNEDAGAETTTTSNELQGVSNVSNKPSAAVHTRDITRDGLFSFLWLAVITGAISLLTPCVFPMVPITVSYFTNHAKGDRSAAVRDALVYALGIILTFTAIGVFLAIVFGAAGINNFAASPYVNAVIALIFILFALSLFGAYELGIPYSLLTKIDAFSRGRESREFVGFLLMGFVFSLTSFTCTAPFVGSLLVLAAQGDWAYPVLGMLVFSSVFALPFFVLALAPRLLAQLPRSGGWLNSVKVVMGFLEIAAAMKFISNVDLVLHWGIFTREVVLATWVAVALMTTLYLVGVFQLSNDAKPERLGAARVLFALLFMSLGFYLLTGLFGAKLGELESFLPIPLDQSAVVMNESGKGDAEEWIKNDYDSAVTRAKAENKQIFIDFTGYTCANCRWMEMNMFPRPEVQAELKKFVKVQLFTDGEGEIYEKQQEFQQQKFDTVALPLYAIVDPSGAVKTTFPGLTRDKDEFLSFLRAER